MFRLRRVHARLAVTVHTCTHASRLADLGRMEAVQADALQRLADLVAYTSHARTGGSAESVRLHHYPAEVVTCVEDYARDVINLLAGDDCAHDCAHGFAVSCPLNCN